MFTLRAVCTACLLSAALVTTVSAQTAKTREQVSAEFEQARRSGDVLGSGEAGLTLRELHPQTYPSAQRSLVSRSSVIADLAQAQANGDTLAAGEIGLPLNEVSPRLYPSKVAIASRSRADVKAEVREAVRDGGLLASGEVGLPLNQVHPRAYAHRESMRADALTPSGSTPMAMAH